MKILTTILVFVAALLFACGGSDSGSKSTSSQPKAEKKEAPKPKADPKGIGEVKSVKLNNPLDPAMIEHGKGVYEMKCAACHKLTAKRVVGPGWEGITSKRQPEWIMNMVLNVDVMLEKDPTAREMLEECLVRMPNQNLSKEDARNVLEFMYANDEAAPSN